jgi:hypothetical protein
VSEIKTFFRSCPVCGRKFQIRLVSKKLVGNEVVKETLTPSEAAVNSSLIPEPSIYFESTILEEGQPIIVDTEEFQYSYKCKHCGHEWSEKHEEEHEVKTE